MPSSSQMKTEFEVTLGSVVNPVSFWITRKALAPWLQRLHQDLDDHFQRPFSAAEFKLGCVKKALLGGQLVAVKVKGQGHKSGEWEWGRGRLVGDKLYKCHDGQVASIFMVDSGRILEGVKVADRVRNIPEYLEEEDNEVPQAVNIVISGLVPISMSTQLDMFWSSSSFSPTVTRDWPGSAHLLIRTLMDAAMTDCDLEEGSKILVTFDKGQKASNFMTGEVKVILSRRAAKLPEIKKHNLPLTYGEEIDIRQLLLKSKHAARGAMKKNGGHVAFDRYQLPLLPLLKEPPASKKKGLDPYETMCRKRKNTSTDGSVITVAKSRESLRKIEAQNEILRNRLMRDLRIKSHSDFKDVRQLQDEIEEEEKRKKSKPEPLDDWGEMWDSLRSKHMRDGRRSGLPHAAIMKMADKRKRIM